MTTTTARMATRRFGASSEPASPAPRRSRGGSRVHIPPLMAPFPWMTALAITVAMLGTVAILRDGVPSAASATIAVRVAPSDTLWSIAEAHRIPGVSTARTVEAIARINGLSGTLISAGATLRVPAIAVVDSAFAQAEEPSAIR